MCIISLCETHFSFEVHVRWSFYSTIIALKFRKCENFQQTYFWEKFGFQNRPDTLTFPLWQSENSNIWAPLWQSTQSWQNAFLWIYIRWYFLEWCRINYINCQATYGDTISISNATEFIFLIIDRIAKLQFCKFCQSKEQNQVQCSLWRIRKFIIIVKKKNETLKSLYQKII